MFTSVVGAVFYSLFYSGSFNYVEFLAHQWCLQWKGSHYLSPLKKITSITSVLIVVNACTSLAWRRSSLSYLSWALKEITFNSITVSSKFNCYKNYIIVSIKTPPFSKLGFWPHLISCVEYVQIVYLFCQKRLFFQFLLCRHFRCCRGLGFLERFIQFSLDFAQHVTQTASLWLGFSRYLGSSGIQVLVESLKRGNLRLELFYLLLGLFQFGFCGSPEFLGCLSTKGNALLRKRNLRDKEILSKVSEVLTAPQHSPSTNAAWLRFKPRGYL